MSQRLTPDFHLPSKDKTSSLPPALRTLPALCALCALPNPTFPSHITTTTLP